MVNDPLIGGTTRETGHARGAEPSGPRTHLRCALSRRGMMAAAAGLGSALVFASMGDRRAWADATPAVGGERHEGHGDADVNDVLPGAGPWQSEDLAEPEERRSVN